MTWLVLFIVFGVAGVIAFFVGVAGVQLSRPDPESGRGGADPSAKAFRRWGFGLAGLMAVVEIVLTIASSVYIIGAGHIGVVYGFGGGKIVSHLDSGTHFVAPWREVKDASVQVQKAVFDYTGDQAAVSKESQAVYATLLVNYQLDPQRVVWLYTNVGPSWFEKLMEGRAAQDFKEVTAEYSTPDITPHREQIRQRTLAAMKRELAQYSIDVSNVQIFNLHFAPEYTKAIQDKQIAAQEALAAQSKAQAAINAARGTAQSTLIEATAQAKSNRLLSNSLTRNIIAYQYVQKLAPNVQAVVVGGSSTLVPSGLFNSLGQASDTSSGKK